PRTRPPTPRAGLWILLKPPPPTLQSCNHSDNELLIQSDQSIALVSNVPAVRNPIAAAPRQPECRNLDSEGGCCSSLSALTATSTPKPVQNNTSGQEVITVPRNQNH